MVFYFFFTYKKIKYLGTRNVKRFIANKKQQQKTHILDDFDHYKINIHFIYRDNNEIYSLK